MKKTNFLALLMAIALASTFSLSACSSSDEVTSDNAEPNPTYDGTSVRTDFAFSITKASSTTRMSAENTQESGTTFLGMEHIYLLPFSDIPADNKKTNLNTSGGTDKIHNYALGQLTTTEIAAQSSKKIYSLTLPVGTNNFLFYGKAIRGSKTGFQAGRLSSSFFTADNNVVSSTSTQGASAIANTKDVYFNLVSIAPSLGEEESKILGYLNQIAQTTGWVDCVDIVANPTGHTDIENPGAYSSLADLYTKFTAITNDRCGSAEAIERTILDLFKGARAINAASSVEAVKTIANAICTNIDKKYNDEVRVTVSASDADPANWTAAFTGIPRTFPANHDLPMGAAQLSYDTTNKKFSYKTAVSPGTTVVTSGANLTDICYPAELVYYDNSPLRATDSYKKESDYPSTPANWDLTVGSANGFTSDWGQVSVKATTRAVAMKHNVNYGVALLESNVALAGGVTSFTDNMSAVIPGASDQTGIVVSNFEVTGLLIGGQPASVDWDMTNPNDGFAHVIYDHDVQYGIDGTTGHTLSTTGSANNYTVVLDNYKTGDTQPDVRIALELKNKGNDFYGADGMIPAGSTFYLVGNLALSSAGNHTIPQINGEARSSVYRITQESTKRVFIQDYKTVANIKLSANALKSAYSTIPDLRSTEVLFGLSVDLTWEHGLEFNVDM